MAAAAGIIGGVVGVFTGDQERRAAKSAAGQKRQLIERSRAEIRRAGELEAEERRLIAEDQQKAIQLNRALQEGKTEEIADIRREQARLQEKLARITEEKATVQEVEGIQDVAQQEKSAFNKAQKLLKRTSDTAVSNLEAANLRQQGLISDAEEAFITTLNQTESGAIETLKSFDEFQQQEKVGFEANIISDLTQAGFDTQQLLSGATGKAIQSITGLSDQAVEELRPFAETGRRANLQSRVLQGLATKTEKQEFEQEFGGLQESPGFRRRLEEAERSEERRQRAIGRTFSGRGFEEFQRGVTERATEQELERQAAESRGLTQLGLGAAGTIAGLRQQTGQVVGGLEQQLGFQQAQDAINQINQISSLRERLGLSRTQTSGQVTQALANLGISFGQQKAGASQQALLTQAQLAGQLGQDVSNIGLATGQAGLGLLKEQSQQEALRGLQLTEARTGSTRRLGQIGEEAITRRGDIDAQTQAQLAKIGGSAILGGADVGAAGRLGAIQAETKGIRQAAQLGLSAELQAQQQAATADLLPLSGALAGLQTGLELFGEFG